MHASWYKHLSDVVSYALLVLLLPLLHWRWWKVSGEERKTDDKGMEEKSEERRDERKA